MADEILYAVADSIATITLNRPERRNALDTALMEALAAGSTRSSATRACARS